MMLGFDAMRQTPIGLTGGAWFQEEVAHATGKSGYLNLGVWTRPISAFHRSSMAAGYPWNDSAVLVHDVGGGIRRVVGEGSLRQIARRVEMIPKANWEAYRIALPDRGSAPFIIERAEFADLLLMQPMG